MKFFKHILYLSALLLTTQGAFAQISKAGSETAVNTVTANSQRAVSVSHNSSGEYAIVWESFDKTVDTDDSGIWMRIYNANGTDLVASSLFNSTYTTGSQSFPAVALNADGDYVVAWMTNDGEGTDVDGWGIRMSYRNTDGTTFRNQIVTNTTTTGNQKFPRVALAESGSFMVVWESDGDIKAQRFNAVGSADGSEMAINTNTSGGQLVPDVAVDDDGDYIVVWQSDTTGGNFDIHAQRYNSAGVAQGTEFKINTTTSEHQLSPRVAMDDAGNFVVSWSSYAQDGDDYGIYARRFLSDGTAATGEFLVNTTTSSTQHHSSVDIGSDGSYIISWTSFGEDGDNAGVYAQAFSPTDVKKGSAVLVNTTTSAFQTLPAVSMTDDAGKALFVWQSGEPDSTNTQDGDDYGIFLQSFDVADMVDPVAVAQDLTVYLDANGDVAISGADLDNGSTDNVGVTSYTASKTAFDCNDLGSDNTVTLTVADAAGNEDTDTSVITVLDTISPVVVTQDITITLNSEGVASFSDQDIDNGSTDNCGIASYVASNTVFGNSDLGENEVTLTVTDDSGNDKSATATVTVVKIAQSITFDALSPVTYGDADFGLGATASSGLSVNYSSSNTSVAVINGTSVEIIGVGTTTITASQAGDANHDAAADVQRLLTVNELSITVTADDKSKDFGDADPGFTFSVTSGALVGSDSFTGDLTRDAGESLGQYDITIGTLSAGSNYDLTYVKGVFEIFDLTDPVFTSGNTFSVAEGAIGTVFTAVATDLRTVSYALGTGGDESLFNISDGAVSFKNAPDFETPVDGNTDNIYVINVEASDGVNTVTQAVSITVTDVDEIDPVFTSGTAVNFAENGESTAYTAVATDANAITYSLGTSNDESDFNIDVTTGIVTFKSSPDFENPTDGDTNNDYVIDVKANDGLNEAVLSVTITVTDVDEIDPVFTSGTAVDFAENGVGTAYTAVATDANAITYSLGTGNDESDFNIDVTTGIVTFKSSPDFENPTDGDTNNDYVIDVKANDGLNEAVLSVTITVTDVDEIDPVFTSGAAVDFAENGVGTAYTAVATDANSITYSLGAGNDESDFNIDGSTGVITFKSGPDFESPADGDTNNDYVIEVKANDGLNEAVQTVTITVTDVDEIDPVFTSGTAVDFAENGMGTAYAAVATDANAINYSLGAGNDESDFNIDVTTGIVTFKSGPDFESPADGDTNNDYVIEVKANDGLNEAVQTVTITVTDVDEIDPVFTSGTAVDFAENGMGTAYAAVATDANAITYSLGSGNDESLFNIDGSTGIVTFIVSPDFENPTDGNTDNAYVIAVKANDGLNEVSQTVTITVTDVFEDPARPNLIGSDPLDDATDFAGTTITLTFDRNVFKGSGTIEVLDASDDAQLFSKGVNHADISINGAVVTIDMKSALALDKDVYLNVPATAFKDVNDGFFVGITDKTTLNFSTPSSPVLVSSTPADDAVEFGGTTIDLTFDRTMSKGNGLITLFDASDDSQVWSVGVNNPNVTINGSMVSLSVGSLSEDKAYYLNIGASALKDTNGRSYAGISDNSTLNFASLTSPVLLASNPMDNAIDFSGTSISLTFDSDMSKGAGVITLFDASDDSHVWSVGVNNPNVAITGTVVTLNTGSLPLDKDFYLNVGASALMDAQGLKYAGISDKTTLNFSGQTSPQLISSSPADGATGYDGTTVALTFDRNMLKGAGTVSLSDASTDAQVWARGINHPDITINGATVTFAVGTLPIDKEFYVNIASTALKDATGLFYAGIADKTTLNFFGRTSPVLVSSTPEDDAIDFDATSIVLNFDKDVSKGAGTISLKDASDDSEVWGVGVNHPNVVVSGSTVTLNVGALPLDEDFYLNIGSQAFKDNQDAFYSGISDKTTLNFFGPTTPKLISSNPADDATGFSGTSMTLTFDRNVVKGYGAIAIFDASDDSKLKGAGVNVGAITINGAVVTINLGGGLPADKDVYLNIAATAFKDADNRFYAGISDKTTLNFDTNTPVPSRNPSDLTKEIAGGQESGIWLYPNPATNKITIDLSAAGEAPDVQITDATGAGKFLKEKVEQRLLTIDVSQYAGGVYIVLVRNQDGSIAREKFMIRR